MNIQGILRGRRNKIKWKECYRHQPIPICRLNQTPLWRGRETSSVVLMIWYWIYGRESRILNPFWILWALCVGTYLSSLSLYFSFFLLYFFISFSLYFLSPSLSHTPSHCLLFSVSVYISIYISLSFTLCALAHSRGNCYFGFWEKPEWKKLPLMRKVETHMYLFSTLLSCHRANQNTGTMESFLGVPDESFPQHLFPVKALQITPASYLSWPQLFLAFTGTLMCICESTSFHGAS